MIPLDRFHKCAWCRRLIWPWQTWVCLALSESYFHNTVKLDCYGQYFRAECEKKGMG
jgi:hypothetical protein